MRACTRFTALCMGSRIVNAILVLFARQNMEHSRNITDIFN